MAKIYPLEEGKTFEAYKKFLKKLKNKGAKSVDEVDDSEVIIVFCPIVTRYETDLNSALSNPKVLKKKENQKLILVAMHHTRDPDYTTPSYRELKCKVDLTVDCLFHEKKGLLKCPKTKTAYDSVRKELDPKYSRRRRWSPFD